MHCYSAVVAAWLLLMFVQCQAKTNNVGRCVIWTSNATELREPIYATNATGKLAFHLPQNNSVTLRDQQQLIVACPNAKNTLVNSNANISTAVCSSNSSGKLQLAGKLYDAVELQCNRSVRGDIRKTATKCGGGGKGVITQIGYHIGAFLSLIDVCHDAAVGSTLYTEHYLYGDSIKNASRSRFRPGFSTQGLNVSASVAYKQSYQRATLSKLLGSPLQAERYISDKSYLSRGHLAPDADFFFAPWQFATYFYLNAAPQWQVINGGNWHKLEAMVRRAAAAWSAKLHVLTGTHDVLRLNTTAIHLLPHAKLPVPKYFWKMIVRGTEAIVFVASNNPFEAADLLCEVDVCAQYGWQQDIWQRVDKGALHCCEWSAFARHVSNVPAVRVLSVLRAPNKTN